MQTVKPIPGGSGPRPTSAAFRKAARWLKDRLQAATCPAGARTGGQTEEKPTERAGISEDALRIMRERYHIEDER